MGGDRLYLILLLLFCIPLGLFFAQLWARSRPPGVARLEQAASEAEPVPEPGLKPELQPDPDAGKRD